MNAESGNSPGGEGNVGLGRKRRIRGFQELDQGCPGEAMVSFGSLSLCQFVFRTDSSVHISAAGGSQTDDLP